MTGHPTGTPPTREDVAAVLIVRECAARGHPLPEEPSLRPTSTVPEPSGGTRNRQETTCPGCGTREVQSWNAPADTSGTYMIMAVVTYEPPEPGDIPGLADRAARLTDEEFTAGLAEAGWTGPLPEDLAPDRRATARRETLTFTLPIRAGQFHLLDSGREPADIIPIPPDAAGNGLSHGVPGATVLWTASHQGPVRLTVVVSPDDPGADQTYQDIAELPHRATTGHTRLTALGDATYPLPPLPAGYGAYRLRYHVRGADAAPEVSDVPVDGYLLQIWPAPHRRPEIVRAGSRWATRRATITEASDRPTLPCWPPVEAPPFRDGPG
ncbi:hypothetical protein [Actinomadura kijaniata]|uniref:hypothetical protein n=1 Tax=Actinomadura kijaniata TaxID=46161 RepID=UPI0008379F83|nr:hypothetical protein [Actinomadura kijaniata]